LPNVWIGLQIIFLAKRALKLAVGANGGGHSGSHNIFSSSELSDLAEAGAVGDISLRLFDKNGKPVKTPLDDRVIGLPLEDLE
ncbi:sugar-binding domain-containing protein, partial [Rhizobium leguminosarum]|uniref:sugar-binding domain-containing protein n=1 Tax=Rhizobium leguminosarum TaxID=384 RepID=UPI003F9463C8